MNELMASTKQSRHPSATPGKVKGTITQRKVVNGGAPERLRGLLIASVEPPEPSQKSENHVRHQDLGQTDHNAGRIVDETQGLADDPKSPQGRIDQSLVAEDQHPAISSHDGTDQKRRDADDREHALPVRRGSVD